MADTATYAGAMKTATPGPTRGGRYPDTPPYVPRGRYQRRRSKGTGDLPAHVRRRAAQKRLGENALKLKGQGSKTGRPSYTHPRPNANGLRPA